MNSFRKLPIESKLRSVVTKKLGQPNNKTTRISLTHELESVIESHGYYDNIIVCDERNNTPNIVNNNNLVVDVYLKKSIGVNFTTIRIVI